MAHLDPVDVHIRVHVWDWDDEQMDEHDALLDDIIDTVYELLDYGLGDEEIEDDRVAGEVRVVCAPANA